MKRTAAILMAWVLLLHTFAGSPVRAYVLNHTVADARDARNTPLSSCPKLNRFNVAAAGSVDRRWNTTLSGNIRTNGVAVNDVEQSILEAFTVWTSVSGARLTPTSLGTLTRTSTGTCNSNDGLNTICMNQSASFASGVLAFTNVVTSDILGESFPTGAPASQFTGEILDADVLFNPAVTFATPAALPTNASAFDLESVMIHELGHFFGFGHSAVWRAMMYPFVPPAGQFTGDRPTLQAPDGPLSEDDRTGLRVLYPDPADTIHIGSVSGRIVPANPLSLATQPAGVMGIFGAHVVAVDDATGAVIGATLGGWSCSDPGPVQFDGTYRIERLPVGRNYRVYAEPLDGTVTAGNVNGLIDLCRPYPTDVTYPAQFSCTVPGINTNFTVRTRP